jgi:hypothetical protein
MDVNAIDWIEPGSLVCNTLGGLVFTDMDSSPYEEKSIWIKKESILLYLGNKELLFPYPEYYDINVCFATKEKIGFVHYHVPYDNIAKCRQEILDKLQREFTILK